MSKQNIDQLNIYLTIVSISIAFIMVASNAIGSLFECAYHMGINKSCNQALESQAGLMMPFNRFIE